jgi:hypothetical protein
MNKITSFFVFVLCSVAFAQAQWQKISIFWYLSPGNYAFVGPQLDVLDYFYITSRIGTTNFCDQIKYVGQQNNSYVFRISSRGVRSSIPSSVQEGTEERANKTISECISSSTEFNSELVYVSMDDATLTYKKLKIYFAKVPRSSTIEASVLSE